ncbi:DNA-directed RNA polymerase [Synchytrium microbalum]|uniref:DNA-directed RNA polymerase subunit beta n=1 Tax=Synchytrium microbalum TaxID=1806994 RepID=A0A507C863_9FUNG|nr:DNA-directed RNA polymerase [Synchytrium microbalum]TPX33685.1 DNA-directed RNA polymerase [Synchytrium microbalum]
MEEVVAWVKLYDGGPKSVFVQVEGMRAAQVRLPPDRNAYNLLEYLVEDTFRDDLTGFVAAELTVYMDKDTEWKTPVRPDLSFANIAKTSSYKFPLKVVRPKKPQVARPRPRPASAPALGPGIMGKTDAREAQPSSGSDDALRNNGIRYDYSGALDGNSGGGSGSLVQTVGGDNRGSVVEKARKMTQQPADQMQIGRGKGSSIFENDVIGRDELRYAGKKLTDPINTAEDKWRLLPAFLQTKGLIKQHIDSYNYFIETELKKIIQANSRIESDVDDRFWLEFKDIRVEPPTDYDSQTAVALKVTPQICRLRDVTYAGNIVVDFQYTKGLQVVSARGKAIGRMPIMLRSSKCALNGLNPEEVAGKGECPLDPGGYFIIKGVEKVVLIQEQLSKNRIIVETDRQGQISASVTSSTQEKKSKTNIVYTKAGQVVLKHNSLTADIPIAIVMKAMGTHADIEIAELVCGSDQAYLKLFEQSIECPTPSDSPVLTQTQALRYIGQRVRLGSKTNRVGFKLDWVSEARDVLANTVLAHIPVEPVHGRFNFRPKVIYVALMVRRVLQAVLEGGAVDDRDFVGNKRLELAGQLLALLFEDLFKSWTTFVKRAIDTQLKKTNRSSVYDAATSVSQSTRFITEGLFRAISTGNWNVKRFKMERAGVTQVLSRLSYVATLGMLTRIQSQFEKTRKISGPRSLQTSQWGMICPCDTPEGEGCGLIKNLALMTHITTDSDDAPLKHLAFQLGVQEISRMIGLDLWNHPNTYLVFLNGVIIGVHHSATVFVRQLRLLRRRGRITPFVSVCKSDPQKSVHISADGGRICRPLIVVEKGKSKIGKKEIRDIMRGFRTFEDLVAEGKVEYLDVNEESDAMVAMYERNVIHVAEDHPDFENNTTHLEIAPFTALGAVAGLVPFPHHNQSARNTFQCAMGKQAMGAIAYNQLNRIETLLYLLVYPEKPLVKTHTIEIIGYDKLPAGQNATVAVMSYSGYDIEDALILNKASLDRGFGRCQVMRKHAIVMKEYANRTHDRIADPQKNAWSQLFPKHSILDPDGIAYVGAKVEQDAILINKEVPTSISTRVPRSDGAPELVVDPSTIPHKPEPLVYRYPDTSVVDQVMTSMNEEGHQVFKMNIRQTRRPEIGDKFSSRHGQKGVCGLIVSQEDLPFSDAGIVPDIIMNPHGFPSRMTVGKLIEFLAGKAGVLEGEFQYGTAFKGAKVDDMSEILVRNGFAYSGKDCFTSGITGEPLKAYIFNGPVYYQKLKHMVVDKMHARSKGPKAALTRQPTEGRSRDGGLRVGEMERDCLIGHGTASLLMERLLLSSDAYDVEVCRECGIIGAWHGYCNYCESRAEVVSIKLPYACKLLFQELMSMNVVPRITVQEWE